MDDAHTYSLPEVERLIGLREGIGNRGARHITLADILSWARDPGGDHTYHSLVMRTAPREAWYAQRGPLDPFSELACVLYDAERAMKKLHLAEQAVVALTAFGFTQDEIAAVMDGREVDGRSGYRELESRRKRIGRMLDGTPRKDAEGKPLLDADGATVHSGGVARKLVRHMNGHHA